MPFWSLQSWPFSSGPVYLVKCLSQVFLELPTSFLSWMLQGVPLYLAQLSTWTWWTKQAAHNRGSVVSLVTAVDIREADLATQGPDVCCGCGVSMVHLKNDLSLLLQASQLRWLFIRWPLTCWSECEMFVVIFAPYFNVFLLAFQCGRLVLFHGYELVVYILYICSFQCNG